MHVTFLATLKVFNEALNVSISSWVPFHINNNKTTGWASKELLQPLAWWVEVCHSTDHTHRQSHEATTKPKDMVDPDSVYLRVTHLIPITYNLCHEIGPGQGGSQRVMNLFWEWETLRVSPVIDPYLPIEHNYCLHSKHNTVKSRFFHLGMLILEVTEKKMSYNYKSWKKHMLTLPIFIE